MDFSDRVAFITGGGGGIGSGMAEAFFERGMKLVLADLDFARAEEVAAGFGDNGMALALDVTSLESWAQARVRVRERFGEVDVLCNNAGVSIAWNALVDVPPEQFDLVMKVNLYGVYNGVKTFGPDMIARRSGHIVNTASFNGLISMGTMGPYSASKFGVTALSVALRQEMAAHGIGVSTIYPGATRSEMTRVAFERYGDIVRKQNLMEPVWIGRDVLRAIEEDRAHIITHPALKPAWDEWTSEVSGAFGDPSEPGFVG